MKEKEAGKKILTLGEVSTKLRICRTTAAHLLRDGVLPGLKLGRQWRIVDADVDAFLRGRDGQPSGTEETRPAA